LCAGLEKAGGSPLPVFCVVKETEAPEEDQVPEDKMLGIAEFEDEYFCGPIWHDEERVFWQALGNKPIFTFGSLGKALINPLKARREMKEMGARFKSKGVEGNWSATAWPRVASSSSRRIMRCVMSFTRTPAKGCLNLRSTPS